jgi:hypothetical protein
MKRRPVRKPTRQSAPLTRKELLPIAASTARAISLRNHLSLATLKQGKGNLDAASELLKTTYWTFYIADKDTGTQHEASFVAAEQSLKACIVKGDANGVWALSSDDAVHVQSILGVHDLQLASMPLHVLEKAKARLAKLFEKDEGFPSFCIEE